MSEEPSWAARPWEESGGEGDGAPAGPAKKGRAKGCLVSLALFVVGVVACSVTASLDGSGGDGDGTALAEVSCERRVRDAMRDPSSAQFSDVRAVATGPTKWTVTGSVRGTNGFGGVSVETFACTVTEDGDSHLVTVKFD